MDYRSKMERTIYYPELSFDMSHIKTLKLDINFGILKL